MKTKLLIAGDFTLLVSIGYSQQLPKQLPQQLQVTFKVVDDLDKPVADASVNLFTYQTTKAGEGFGEDVYQKATGTTDTNGMVTLAGSSSHSDIKYGVAPKDGYYYTEPADYQFKQSEGGKWQPWNPAVEIVFRPIIKPVPMYARKVEAYIPKPNQKYGYDLKVGDWVAPNGKGLTADLIFEVVGHAIGVEDNDSTLTLSFSNPLDGIQPFSEIAGSEFLSPRAAPIEGYLETMEWRKIRKPGQWSSDWIDDTKGKTNYFFRVRTVT